MIKLFANTDNAELNGWIETSGLTLTITDLTEASAFSITDPCVVEVVNGAVTETYATGVQEILNMPWEVVLAIKAALEG